MAYQGEFQQEMNDQSAIEEQQGQPQMSTSTGPEVEAQIVLSTQFNISRAPEEPRYQVQTGYRNTSASQLWLEGSTPYQMPSATVPSSRPSYMMPTPMPTPSQPQYYHMPNFQQPAQRAPNTCPPNSAYSHSPSFPPTGTQQNLSMTSAFPLYGNGNAQFSSGQPVNPQLHLPPPAQQWIYPTSNQPFAGASTQILSPEPSPDLPTQPAYAANPRRTTSRPHRQRAYQCVLCPKEFGRPSALESHLLTHTEEKPYMCPEETCKKEFSVPSNLKRHVLSQHKEFDVKEWEPRWKEERKEIRERLIANHRQLGLYG